MKNRDWVVVYVVCEAVVVSAPTREQARTRAIAVVRHGTERDVLVTSVLEAGRPDP